MFGRGRDADEGGPQELFSHSAPVSLGKAPLERPPAASGSPTSGLTPEQAGEAAQRGLDPERVAALTKPISARQLWGFWIPLVVGCVGGSIYLWKHTDPADARHSPAAIAMFPLFAAFWWKTRGLRRRATPGRQLPPGLPGVWAGLTRRDRVNVAKFGALAAVAVGFGVAKLIGAEPTVARLVGLGLGVVAAVVGISAVRRADAEDAEAAAFRSAQLRAAAAAAAGAHDVGPPGYVEPVEPATAPVDERDDAARRALGGLDPNAPATLANLKTVVRQPRQAAAPRKRGGTDALTKRDKWSIVAFVAFALLMEAAHLAGTAHHHKGLYIGLWFAVVSAIVFGAALFDDSRWGTQSAKKARDASAAARDAARGGGRATTTRP